MTNKLQDLQQDAPSKQPVSIKEAQKRLMSSESLFAVANILWTAASYRLPPLTLLTPVIQEKLDKKRCKIRQQFLDEIIALGFSVTPKQLDDDVFLTELLNTIEVIDKLATNEKIQFFANLFHNSFSGKDKFDYDEYEELLRSLSQLSKSEICLLIDFWRASQLQKQDKDNPAFRTSWDRFAAICFDKGIDKERLIAKMTAISRTGLCKEETGSMFNYSGGMFFPTPLLDDLISKIQSDKETFCVKDNHS